MATMASMRTVHRMPTERRDVLVAAGLTLSVGAFVVLVKKLVEAVAALALEGVESQSLVAEVSGSLHELERSRARIQAAADDERRRIERDLHDGAQQRLVALRVRLSLVADLIRDDPMRAPRLLDELGAEVEEALEEVRALAHDVYPAELVEFGLEAALKDLAGREPIRTTVDTDGIDRLTPEIEATVYFCCAEAIENAVEHAAGADQIAIALAVDDRSLRFEVTDNGPGLPAYSRVPGAGFLAMRDRLGAVGGHLDMSAAPGGGTRVIGLIPLMAVEPEGMRQAAR
jgi:signal transduction histidine kinase